MGKGLKKKENKINSGKSESTSKNVAARISKIKYLQVPPHPPLTKTHHASMLMCLNLQKYMHTCGWTHTRVRARIHIFKVN